MWTKQRSVLRLCLVSGILATFVLVAWAAPRVDQWKKVDEANQKGLPKTAIEALGPIIDEALKEKAYPEAIKAIAKRIALEGNIQGNKPEEKITRMKAEIEKVPAEMKPVMDAILANWYWHFFQQNRWRFVQRSQTASSLGDDILTWDLARILGEIDKQFSKALTATDVLKKTPIADYNELLQKGNSPDAYRPTLYDFVAHNALEFYSTGEQAGSKSQDTFELSATSPIFAPADEFVKWNIETADDTSVIVKAIRLYQNLLVFHARDDDRSAYIDTDLWRLHFGYNKAFGEEKNSRYKGALKLLADGHEWHELSTRALATWAGIVHSEGDFVEARKIASVGVKRFPESVGGRTCFNLIQQIEQKQAQLQTERVWNNPLPIIQVRYRNVNKMWFRVVEENWEAKIGNGQWRPEWMQDAERKALLAKPAVKEWSVDLPVTEDFQERVEEIPAPEGLKRGFYYIIASHDEKFSATNNFVTFTNFWVSDLSLVLRNRQEEGVLEGFVLNADTGEPIVEAVVKSWVHQNNNSRTPGPTATSDKNGLFRLTGLNQQQVILLAKTRDDQLASANDIWNHRQDLSQRPYSHTIFFTDRALYRPGQTIQFKGICIRVEAEQDNYKVLPNQSVNVVFNDPNGKEIAKQQLKTNDFGSFSGSFTAPRDRLMGRMNIFAMGELNGATQVNVEEYKRPKFQVALDAPKTAAKLNGPVSLQGHATAYTGAAIDGANVRWRVVRQVRYPDWWGWCFWWRQPHNDSQEIAHGFAKTGTDGSFTIEFIAKPDTKVLEKDEPIFSYSIHADVTDGTGETRSGDRSVNVGYTALRATVSAESWQTADQPVVLTIKTTTLDHEGQAADVKLKIYKLVQPKSIVRPTLIHNPYPHFRKFNRSGQDASATEPKPDPANPNSWPLGELVEAKGLTTDAAGKGTHSIKLAAGIYRVMLESSDRFGKPVTARAPLQVLDPTADKLVLRLPHLFAAPKWSLEPGSKFTALWGSGYETARAFIEIEHRRKSIQAYWTDATKTQATIQQEITEAMRGGFTVRVTMVRENRAYLDSHRVDVPWSNKQLEVKWERFTSKLEPAQKEKWTATITGPNAQKAVAEMAATLYDASLDAYQPHHWMSSFGVFRQDNTFVYSQFENQPLPFHHLVGHWPHNQKDTSLIYRHLPQDIAGNFWGYAYFGRGMGGRPGARQAAMAKSANGVDADKAGLDQLAAGDGSNANRALQQESQQQLRSKGDQTEKQGNEPSAAGPDLSKVAARSNLNETAFFFPQLVSTKEGEVVLEFTMPEALTEWKFLGFAHDKDLRGGLLQDKVVTSKDLMIQPNPPRFVREGDQIEFTVKVSNQSAGRQTGKVRLTLADARTLQSVDASLGNTLTDLAFDIPSKESKSFSWRLKVPDGLGFVTYKAVGSSGRVSDGEEGFLPVLSRRILVTESLPLPIRGKQTKEFDFTKLSESGKSGSLQNKLLSVQMVSNPSWYAVMALPYLMESPHPCTEQVFNRLYANSLARHIAASDPKIRRVFDQWKNFSAAQASPSGEKLSDPLDSPLFKNQDLKSVMIEETPWYRQAVHESEARRNVGILFDDNRLNDESAKLQKQLAELQHGDGAWSWFPGGPANDYVTLYITTGYGRLRHLGVKVDTAPAVKSLTRLDGWITEIYQHIKNRDQNHLSSTIAFYLYGRSFFLADKPIAPQHKEAVDYFLGQAKKYWLQLPIRQSQGHLAIALKRFGDKPTADGIMASLKERSVSNEEMGMFWRDLELSFYWYRAPIETQALMIEAFDEVAGDLPAVEDLKVWLLKQKQTQDWKTTKATADAIYALLLRGSNVLASDALVQISLANQEIKPDAVEAGTGFFEKRFVGPEIKPNMGKITLTKTDDGVAWGSLNWQYLEDTSKVTPHEGTPLKLRKALFVKQNTKKGQVLEPIKGAVRVGDELVSRIELRVDRDMEYVHLKDHRGSGTEPTNVLSRYKYQDGLGYYESTRDTASHFFIDYLPKGTYVFEYSVRVQHKGRYQTGLASIQCMYAPEFNSHSESVLLEVNE